MHTDILIEAFHHCEYIIIKGVYFMFKFIINKNRIKKAAICFVAIALCSIFSFACKKKYRNYVDIEQINIDSSHNYRYIFKRVIEEERKKENRSKKNEFRE